MINRIHLCELCKSQTNFLYSKSAGGYLCDDCLVDPSELIFKLIYRINKLEEQQLQLKLYLGANMHCAYCNKKLRAITAIFYKDIEDYLCKECYQEETQEKEQDNDK